MSNLQEEFGSLNIYDECFRINETAIALMVKHGLIKSSLVCNRCSRRMRISNSNAFSDGKVYRCVNKNCRAKSSLKNGSFFVGFNIEWFKVLRVIYCWVYNYTNYQAIALCQISEKTYIKLKELIMEQIGDNTTNNNQIGGADVRVQFDETAICNGLVVINPSSTLDNAPGIQWIVGGVVEGNCREFVLEIVPNRQSTTLEDIFTRRVRPGSIIVTDGYPSYPSAVTNFGSRHEVVNHSIGFMNADGAHTNQIENIWSHLKQEYRARGGINRGRIILFLKEFIWKKTNICNADQETLKMAFIKIVEFFKNT